MSQGNPTWQPPGGGWQQPPSGQTWPQMPGQGPVIIQNGDPDLTSRVTRWMFGQPAVVVLLFCLLIAIGWGARYLIITGIPAHLAQIQAGYERINSDNNEANTKRDERHASELAEVRAEAGRREALVRELLKADPPAKAAAAAAMAPEKPEGKGGT